MAPWCHFKCHAFVKLVMLMGREVTLVESASAVGEDMVTKWMW